MADEVTSRKKHLVSWCKTIVVWVGTFASAWALGKATGVLAGESGPESGVVAATIPAILSLAGGGVAWFAVRSQDMMSAVCAFVFIVTFCVFFLEYVEVGVTGRRAYAEESLRTTEIRNLKKRRLDRRRELKEREYLLKECTQMEIRINKTREMAGQTLLPPEYFCEVPP